MITNEKDAIKTYNSLLRGRSEVADKMSNVQREKDYKVQRIEKRYESKINIYINLLDNYDLEIEKVKKYIKEH